MKKFIWIALAISPIAIGFGQPVSPEPTASPLAAGSAATPADVEALRQQVQSLTETVKALQHQVKDQQAVLEKANLTGTPSLPQSEGGTPSVASTPSEGRDRARPSENLPAP